MRNLGLGILGALFCATLIGACSASGNDPNVVGTGSGSNDSGAAADTSYTYEAGSSSTTTYDSGTTSKPYDAGTVTVIDSGPPPTVADCDLSDPSTLFTDFTAAESGGDGPCGTADACGSGDCCMNFASIGIPAAFAAIFSSASAPVCVAN